MKVADEYSVRDFIRFREVIANNGGDAEKKLVTKVENLIYKELGITRDGDRTLTENFIYEALDFDLEEEGGDRLSEFQDAHLPEALLPQMKHLETAYSTIKKTLLKN